MTKEKNMSKEEEEKKVVEVIERGTTSSAEIAKQTEVQQEKIEQIKKSLKEKGVLKDAVVINSRSDMVNKRMIIYHFYKCRAGVQQIAEAAKTFAELPYIEEVHSIVGEFDLLVKFRVKDMDEYNRMLNGDIWTCIEAAGIVYSMDIVAIHTYVEKANYVSEFKEF